MDSKEHNDAVYWWWSEVPGYQSVKLKIQYSCVIDVWTEYWMTCRKEC